MNFLFENISKLIHFAADAIIDRYYQIETVKQLELYEMLDLTSTDIEHARKYQATRYIVIYLAFKKFQKISQVTSSNLNMIDIGCGKGRVLKMAKSYSFKQLIGVEISSRLCSIAKNNLKSSNVKILCSHCLDVNYPDDTNLYFLYNPFDSKILSEFLTKIDDIATKHGAYIIYVNPIREYLLYHNGWTLLYQMNGMDPNNRICFFKK